MRIDVLLDELDKDLVIQPDELGKESTNIPFLHNKYYRKLVVEKRHLREANDLFAELKSKKFLWYSGKLSTEELKKEGWQPYPHVLHKVQIPLLMDGDADLNQTKKMLEEQEEVVTYLLESLKMICSRHWQIKNGIEWAKFMSGVGGA